MQHKQDEAPLLSARGLSKSFGAVRVLHNVDFEARAGEVLGILGPNGAGKTTLFNLISGDIRDYGGDIRFGGQPLAGPPFERCRQGIGRTYQIPLPYGAMTTFENLLVAASFGGGMSEAESYDHCAMILEDCDLMRRANVNAGMLTLLDRKRLELARALASKPRLLLLDEIAGGLTEEEGKDLVALIGRIRDSGITIIWIEHVLHALFAVADRLLVLNFGEKIAEGLPAQVIENPEVKRVYMGVEA
ncbi:ABC transporter ATP-binding protein [Roseinatronobacter sp. S2]|uniref:ABC transporter ATP-binding protein n=1 Tax=Roseinatronobacter sp. S2 TaxID=3035471 RepID=UPI00240F119D|nr:ABC transporter ATP-binding protein [Roseinatronobacter sp. S2]WFE74808.1 ABC transporter ATP-binding protein [Roseinatronobacter sp. S2]